MVELIIIKDPFRLEMELMERDDHFPSVRMKIYLDAPHPTGSYIYSASDIWFSLSEWNQFLSSFNEVVPFDRDAVLKDMSDLFSISISNSGVDHKIKIVCKEPSITASTPFMHLAIEQKVDADTINVIKRKFFGTDD